MAKKEKFYAIKKGRQIGIYTNWAEVKKLVIGYPGAIYKSFETREDAETYLKGDTQDTTEVTDEYTVTAYVDGSFDKKAKKYAYGCIFILPNKTTVEHSGNGNDEELLKMRNVSGEVLAARYAVDWAVKHQYQLLHLYYDYAGIEHWATKSWKTNLEFTKSYAEFMEEKMKSIKIQFHKVKAHSGNEYNEKVDKLAKEALNS